MIIILGRHLLFITIIALVT